MLNEKINEELELKFDKKKMFFKSFFLKMSNGFVLEILEANVRLIYYHCKCNTTQSC